ncbi:hypothetical protein NPIL_414471 [Nephila pilipes]|uniref:C2H2-type domain-containing protein n=1 Tax=Nephila pilipes TaxID=299642 RepID=A0A8X6NQG9_NEPPI|nr:hypothetical protein NPIL_414471 [Nephila pilipes]
MCYPRVVFEELVSEPKLTDNCSEGEKIYKMSCLNTQHESIECFYCHQIYETQEELSIHAYIHSSRDEQSFPVFALREIPRKKKPFLEDFRTVNGRFHFPVLGPLKRKIPAKEVLKTNPSKVQKRSPKTTRSDNVNTVKVRSDSTDSGNYSDESTRSE